MVAAYIIPQFAPPIDTRILSIAINALQVSPPHANFVKFRAVGDEIRMMLPGAQRHLIREQLKALAQLVKDIKNG
ncbi:MAG: hypothetical protein A3H35_09695 [Betaproteobacteria bacterium RIFCSPLOWO2_02_FULL_62_17]|nr:MAG: hypothetical protein A3H35_09695 [Betaproteobacteria bacterium RIFCSPLOWO2_02_FULL_62_17]